MDITFSKILDSVALAEVSTVNIMIAREAIYIWTNQEHIYLPGTNGYVMEWKK